MKQLLWINLFALTFTVVFPSRLQSTEFPTSETRTFNSKLKEDSEIIQGFRKKLAYMADYALMDAIPPEGIKKPFYIENFIETWKCFLDNLMALDSIGRAYTTLAASGDPMVKRESFKTAYWVFLIEYRFSLEWINALAENHEKGELLNQPLQELGLPAGSYADFKTHVQSVEKSVELIVKDRVYFSYGSKDNLEARASQIQEDKNSILKMNSLSKLVPLAKVTPPKANPMEFSGWFPLNRETAPWKGKPNPWFSNASPISLRQVEFLVKNLKPGDMLFSHREWDLPNVGLPGYWNRAALFIGDSAARADQFNLPEIAEMMGRFDFKGDLEGLLKKNYHDLYPLSAQLDGKGHIPRLIEATPDGVRFKTLESFVEADSLCVLRPRLSTMEKAYALMKGFKYLGRPFDFNYDYDSDSAIAGSELLYLIYKPEGKRKGLIFPVRTMLGNHLSSPNAIVAQFDSQFETLAQQTDLIAFLDSRGWPEPAEFMGMGEFRQSWKRPKWRISLPNLLPKTAHFPAPPGDG